MHIYTSYFYQLRNLKEDEVAISISRLDPSYKSLEIRYTDLAPNPQLFIDIKSGRIDLEAYKVKYKEQLSFLNPTQVVADLARLANGKKLVICCHCKPDGFCHRFIVSQWLIDFGYSVSEYTIPQGKYQDGYLKVEEKSLLFIDSE